MIYRYFTGRYNSFDIGGEFENFITNKGTSTGYRYLPSPKVAHKNWHIYELGARTSSLDPFLEVIPVHRYTVGNPPINYNNFVENDRLVVFRAIRFFTTVVRDSVKIMYHNK